MVQFGVIGTNWITERLLEAANDVEDFKLTAVYSRTISRAEEFASKYGVTKIFTNLKEMAVSQEIDAVYIGYSQFISRRTSYFIFAKWQTCVM